MTSMPRPTRPIYLDNQATTPCDPRVVAAMLPHFTEGFGNPHSTEHVLGRQAAAAVETARAQVAALIGADPREVVFTSGATEANNLAIKGAARFSQAPPARRIIAAATEHKCVLESVAALAAEGFAPCILPVAADGIVPEAGLRAALAEPTLLVSVMAVNNETGVIQDVAALAAATHAAGALFHSDLAQAAGKIPLAVDTLGIDLGSLSAHKLYGPKGIGALYVRRRPRTRIAPLFSGGGQERGVRSGTLPVPLIVGFGEACRIAAAEMAEEAARIGRLRDALWDRLRSAIPGLWLNGASDRRVAGNLNLGFPGVPATALIAALPDLCVSTGSACSSAELSVSYVLRSMGLDAAAAASSLRLAIGRFTTAAEVQQAATMLITAYHRLASNHQGVDEAITA